MNANAVPVLSVFEKKLRLEVPLFQRQYVWNREHQWEPLWEDISRKFAEFLNGRNDGPVHFLGAMVLDLKQTPITHVELRQVIDGQQRLTTLQVFLAAFRDFSRAAGCEQLAAECDSVTLNKGMMANPAVDRFKVWPTYLDQQCFTDVMTLGSTEAVSQKYPLIRRKYSRSYEPRPLLVEAYVFFYLKLAEFFVGTDEEPPMHSDLELGDRLESAFTALKSALQVVVIDLDREDDAQVIFETLNARGEPLLPADLLRNYIFLRAGRQRLNQQELYNEYWHEFDDEFWRKLVRQGRLLRPRSDLFMQHLLTSKTGLDIPIKHLFVEYKFWIERSQPFQSVRNELAFLDKQGKAFRRITQPEREDILFPIGSFLRLFDVSTVYPLLLRLHEIGTSDEEWAQVSRILESYLLRRSVCGLTTKAYNRIFVALLKELDPAESSADQIATHLLGLSGETAEWPTDEAFRTAWLSNPAYLNLQQPRVVYVLKKLNDTYLNVKAEKISIDSPLTIEHIMPQNWQAAWMLPDGSTGMSATDLWDADQSDPRVVQTRARDALVHTLGNLTILTQELNSALSNAGWRTKKPELTNSLLPINQQLQQLDSWDEQEIEARGKELFRRALKLWSRPMETKAKPVASGN